MQTGETSWTTFTIQKKKAVTIFDLNSSYTQMTKNGRSTDIGLMLIGNSKKDQQFHKQSDQQLLIL